MHWPTIKVNFIQCRDFHEVLIACGSVFRFLYTCTSYNYPVKMSDYGAAQRPLEL